MRRALLNALVDVETDVTVITNTIAITIVANGATNVVVTVSLTPPSPLLLPLSVMVNGVVCAWRVALTKRN